MKTLEQVFCGYYLDDFVGAYFDAMYFTDTGDEGQPTKDIVLATETYRKGVDECRAFVASAWLAGALDITNLRQMTMAGHDFWLTRNGHGTGFWDRTDDVYGPGNGEVLTQLAEKAGEAETYEGGDGRLYVM